MSNQHTDTTDEDFFKPVGLDGILNELAWNGVQDRAVINIGQIKDAKAALSAMVDGDVIGNDAKCEKNHEEYFDWCSYCDVERVKSELRAEQRQRAIAKGFTL